MNETKRPIIKTADGYELDLTLRWSEEAVNKLVDGMWNPLFVEQIIAKMNEHYDIQPVTYQRFRG